MSRQVNKTAIGAFVVGAIVLVLTGVFIFGSGRLFTERQTYVMYFDSSVKGLHVGAPVQFRGVKIGSVKDIVLRADPNTLSIDIPVYIEIEPDRVERVEKGPQKMKTQEAVALLIERGLRARLLLDSVVTGILMIELDFHPEKPIRLVGAQSEYPEIPTIPSSLEELSRTIIKLPIEDLVNRFISAVSGIERAVNSPKLTESMDNINIALKNVQTLVQHMDKRIESLAPNMEATLKDTRKFILNTDHRVESVATRLGEATEEARKALRNANKTLTDIEGVVEKTTDVPQHLTKTLKELSAAARSVRVLAEYLELHPDALLRGKHEQGGQ